jgi:hypothetical protein
MPRQAEPRARDADPSPAIDVQKGTRLVVVNHSDGKAERAFPAADLDLHVGPLADGHAAIEPVGRGVDDQLVGLAIRLPGDPRDASRDGGAAPGERNCARLALGQPGQHGLVDRGAHIHSARVDDAQHGRSDAHRVARLAQPAREQAVEGRQKRGAYQRNTSLFGAARGHIDSSRGLRTLGKDAVEVGTSDA